MHFGGSGVEECLDVVAELCAADDGVVAENDALVFKECGVGDELHTGHEVAAGLVAGGEAAGPCGGVFEHGATVGDTVTFGISEGAAYAGVGDTANAVGLGGVGLTHGTANGLAHFFDIDAVVGACGEAVVYPEE